MKSINKRLRKILHKIKLKHYKKIKKEIKSMILIWTTKMPKCMANSFYRLKFRTIDLMTNCWVGGHILTWRQSLSFYLNKTSLITSEFELHILMKVLGNYLIFPGKNIEIIWTFRTRDMGWTLNNIWATG